MTRLNFLDRFKISSILCLLFVSLTTISPREAVFAEGWKAGTAKLAITPSEPMWMSGYAGRKGPAEGALHDLWAKAIVLESSNGQRAVLISLDLVGISRSISQKIAGQLQSAHGLKRSEIAFCTSHTHCGPVLGETLGAMYFFDDSEKQKVTAYTAAFPGKIKQVVAEAFENLEPVTLTYGVGEATFAVNRRENKEPEVPQLRAEGKLKGPVDHAAPALFAKTEDGTVKAVVFGYACHATTLSFMQWCGDWPGFAQIELEKAYPDATALFVTGCGADQNPLPRRKVELAEKYGKQLADAVQAIPADQLQQVGPEFSVQYAEIAIPFSQLPTKKQLEDDLMSANKYVASRAKELLAKLEKNGSLEPTYPYPIQVWSLGPANMVFLGGEVVVDFSLRLKADLDQPKLWVAGYCNDVMSYIPSRRVLLEGGYEGARSQIYYGMPTTWAPQIENLIVDQVTSMVSESND